MRIGELRKRWDAEAAKRLIRVEMTFVDGFLVLGVGTRLAKMGAALDEKRLVALLTAAHGRALAASSRTHIRRALELAGDGEAPMALTHLALSGAAKLANPKEDAQRLFMADELIKDGIDPLVIVAALGFDPPFFNAALGKYSPEQPRVPGGNPEGGQWTNEDGLAAQNDDDSANGHIVSREPSGGQHPTSEMSFADIGTLVAQQELGGVTICIDRSNVFGDFFQVTYSGICPRTMPRPQ